MWVGQGCLTGEGEKCAREVGEEKGAAQLGALANAQYDSGTSLMPCFALERFIGAAMVVRLLCRAPMTAQKSALCRR